METKNQKFQELVKNGNSKGNGKRTIKRRFLKSFSFVPTSSSIVGNNCVCTNTGELIVCLQQQIINIVVRISTFNYGWLV